MRFFALKVVFCILERLLQNFARNRAPFALLGCGMQTG